MNIHAATKTGTLAMKQKVNVGNYTADKSDTADKAEYRFENGT